LHKPLTDKGETCYYRRLFKGSRNYTEMLVIVDAFAFCRNGEKRAGKLRLADLVRLRAECVSDEGEVDWMLVGEMSALANGHPVLHLTINGTVQLKCQRCLGPYVFQIKSDSTIFLAKDEQAADHLDSFLLDEEMTETAEVIVGSKSFDVYALIEDEALLALPLSARHEVCPDDVQMDALANEKKESPFAVLKKVVVKPKK
jgi:uncharacterized protein